MQSISFVNFYKKILLVNLLILFLGGIVLAISSNRVDAQIQGQEFSANQKSSYQCFSVQGDSEEPTDVKDAFGYWLCPCADGSNPTAGGRCLGSTCETGKPGDPGCLAERSTLKPATLQQLEIWFVRIIYVIWAAVGSLSFFFIVVLGYRYMISRGDVTKITEIRQKITYYIIGFVLVFLAVPILTTVFRVFGINNQVQCYNVDMPAFQFVFTDLCTDTSGSFVRNPCEATNVDGLACSSDQIGQRYECERFTGEIEVITCGTNLIWTLSDIR